MSGVRAAVVIAVTAALALGTAGAAHADAPGAISGTVTGGGGIPVCVLVLDSTGQSVANGPTNDDGSYELDGVPAGSWTVEFDPDDACLGADEPQAIQYFPGASTPTSATPVVVAAGATTTDVDATLVTGATIKGTVYDAGQTPIPGVCVILEDTAGNPVLRQPSDFEGQYTLDQLPAGTFIVQYVDDDCAGQTPSYASSYYPAEATPAAAMPLPLRAGQLLGPVDATLTALPGAPGSGTTTGTPPIAGSPTAPTAGAGTTTTGPTTTTEGAGGSGSGTTSAPTHHRVATRRASIRFLRAAPDASALDRHGRLALRLRCTSARVACRATIIVRRPLSGRGTIRGGGRLAARTLEVAAGHTASVHLAIDGVRSGLLWVSVTLPGRPRQVEIVALGLRTD